MSDNSSARGWFEESVDELERDVKELEDKQTAYTVTNYAMSSINTFADNEARIAELREEKIRLYNELVTLHRKSNKHMESVKDCQEKLVNMRTGENREVSDGDYKSLSQRIELARKKSLAFEAWFGKERDEAYVYKDVTGPKTLRGGAGRTLPNVTSAKGKVEVLKDESE